MVLYFRFSVRLKTPDPSHPEVRNAWAHVFVLEATPDAHILAAMKLRAEGYHAIHLLDARTLTDQGLATVPQSIRDAFLKHPSERVHISVDAYIGEQPEFPGDPFDFSTN